MCLKIMVFQDSRDYQIAFLSLFLSLGIFTRDWTIRPDLMLLVITVCLLTQLLLTYIRDFVKDKKEFSWQFFNCLKSALITGLGLCLLLRSNHYETMALAAFLAIASKFIFTYRNKHFFNPANFGIIATLIITNDAWVSPGQWGDDWWYLLLFLGAGSIILKRVGRWDTTATFMLTYGGLIGIRDIFLGWSFDVWQHQLMSGSLILFALFMLTDPRSIPNAKNGRLIWSVLIAILAFILQYQFYLSNGIFWALFIVSPLTIVFDNVWNAPRFNWFNPFKLTLNNAV